MVNKYAAIVYIRLNASMNKQKKKQKKNLSVMAGRAIYNTVW